MLALIILWVVLLFAHAKRLLVSLYFIDLYWTAAASTNVVELTKSVTVLICYIKNNVF